MPFFKLKTTRCVCLTAASMIAHGICAAELEGSVEPEHSKFLRLPYFSAASFRTVPTI